MATLGEIIDGILKLRISNPGRTLLNTAMESGDWTPQVIGGATPGTYQIGSYIARYTRMGRRVWADFRIVMAGALTGGGVGNLSVAGLPYGKAANTYPIGVCGTQGVDWDPAAQLSLVFSGLGASSVLVYREVFDNTTGVGVPITALAANDVIDGSICYETDDP